MSVSYGVDIVTLEERTIYGIQDDTHDQTLPKDIARLSQTYYKVLDIAPGGIFPFYVASRDYDEQTRLARLFIGGEIYSNKLEQLILPAGLYAVIELRNTAPLLWGIKIGKAKRWFYQAWLTNHKYTAKNLEYEYHTEESTGRNPTIRLYFAIQ